MKHRSYDDIKLFMLNTILDKGVVLKDNLKECANLNSNINNYLIDLKFNGLIREHHNNRIWLHRTTCRFYTITRKGVEYIYAKEVKDDI
jgi:predicted transcriptional regulator